MSDDLIEKIKAALSGTRQTEADDEDEPSGNKVPVDRFRAVVREKNEIRRQLADLASAVEAERKSASKAIEEVKAAAAREVASLAAQHQEHLAARDLGFDEDGLVALPIIGKNRMTERPLPYYAATTTIATGGTHTGGIEVEVRICT